MTVYAAVSSCVSPNRYKQVQPLAGEDHYKTRPSGGPPRSRGKRSNPFDASAGEVVGAVSLQETVGENIRDIAEEDVEVRGMREKIWSYFLQNGKLDQMLSPAPHVAAIYNDEPAKDETVAARLSDPNVLRELYAEELHKAGKSELNA